MTALDFHKGKDLLPSATVRPRRISFLINSMEGGGAERAMANLLEHLLPRLHGHAVELILLDDLPTVQTLPKDLTIRTLDGRGKLGRSLIELARHWRITANRPDVCISYLARANVLNALLARWFGHRALISERVNTSSHIAGSRAAPILRWITRLSYPRAAGVIAVSEGVATDLSRNFGVARDRVTVIGNAIDAARLRTLAAQPAPFELPEDFILGMGRLVPNKNFALLLDAYADVPGAPPLVLLGEGAEEANLRAQADRLGISDRVVFAGFVANPYPVVAKARALVSASRAEGFPNTLVEALALSCPVIATDCPSGPAEILDATAQTSPPWSAHAHGLLVPMENRAAMAAAMSTLCNDAARHDYAARAAKRALIYGHDAVVGAYMDIVFDDETNSS